MTKKYEITLSLIEIDDAASKCVEEENVIRVEKFRLSERDPREVAEVVMSLAGAAARATARATLELERGRS